MKLGVWAETFSDLVREHGFPEWICSGAAIVAVATGVLSVQRGGSALPSSVTLTLVAAAVIPWLLGAAGIFRRPGIRVPVLAFELFAAVPVAVMTLSGGDGTWQLAGAYRGRGILGMNERAHLRGGPLDAGPRGGLWVVQCEVPDGGPTTTDVPPPRTIESVS